MKSISIRGLVLVSMLSLGGVSAEFSSDLQFFRYPDQRGLNVFEAPKETDVAFDGLKVRIGGQSALQYQDISHGNHSIPSVDPVSGLNLNALKNIGADFNLATANFDLDIQLLDGVRTHIRTYLSSRHHPEPYVKGGYLQINNLNFISEDLLSSVMEFVTFKVGHMEVNYGDMHFRRSDNAQALFNPFVGNYIMDSFTTEVGMETYFQYEGFLAMVGVTNGKLNQSVADSDKDGTSLVSKIGFDKQFNEDLRLRLTASVYHTSKANPVRLYQGDRAGSRYYFVMENINATAKDNFTSGRYNPRFNTEMTAVMLNAFMKFKEVEIFGTFENASGRDRGENSDRDFTQLAAEVIYRFGHNERFYTGARYNLVEGPESRTDFDIEIKRTQFALGMFLSKNLLAKLEYVKQTYDHFLPQSLFYDGEFDGYVVEMVVAF